MEFTYNIGTEEKIRLAGEAEVHFIKIEKALSVQFITSETGLTIRADTDEKLELLKRVIDGMRRILQTGQALKDEQVDALLLMENTEVKNTLDDFFHKPILLDRMGRPVLARSIGQAEALYAIKKHDLTFLSGAAGTGKTFLAVAMGVHMYRERKVQKIVLVRPAVESGENLGFLPGDMGTKIAPYMTPLMDALHTLIGTEQIKDMSENNRFEIAPLAYMRGRTLSECFVILDEAQNTTIAQMKMFLTRMGKESKVVVTGDESQKDLPSGKPSGLSHALHLFTGHPKIAQVKLTVKDVVRHKLVRDIIEAYEKVGIA